MSVKPSVTVFLAVKLGGLKNKFDSPSSHC